MYAFKALLPKLHSNCNFIYIHTVLVGVCLTTLSRVLELHWALSFMSTEYYRAVDHLMYDHNREARHTA